MITEVICGGVEVHGPPLRLIVNAADSDPVIAGFVEMIRI
jgi:hypothetical protein